MKPCAHCEAKRVRWRMILPTLAVLAWIAAAMPLGAGLRLVVVACAR